VGGGGGVGVKKDGQPPKGEDNRRGAGKSHMPDETTTFGGRVYLSTDEPAQVRIFFPLFAEAPPLASSEGRHYHDFFAEGYGAGYGAVRSVLSINFGDFLEPRGAKIEVGEPTNGDRVAIGRPLSYNWRPRGYFWKSVESPKEAQRGSKAAIGCPRVPKGVQKVPFWRSFWCPLRIRWEKRELSSRVGESSIFKKNALLAVNIDFHVFVYFGMPNFL